MTRRLSVPSAALLGLALAACGADALGTALDAGPIDASANDTGVRDASTNETDASGASACAPLGASCVDTGCCGGGACVPRSTDDTRYCAEACTESSACATGCCAQAFGDSEFVCSPTSVCNAVMAAKAPSCPLVVVAGDGTVIGKASTDASDPSAVCGLVSYVAGVYSPLSLFNPTSLLGNAFSSTSAYNPAGDDPPALRCKDGGAPLAYITKAASDAGTPVIDPDFLCTTLARMQL